MNHPDLTDIWSAIAADLRDAVGTSAFDVWLAGLRPVGFDGRRLVVHAPDETRGWIAERFGRVLQSSCEAILGSDASVELHSGAASSRGSSAGGETDAAPVRDLPDAPLNPKYTFDQFVIGTANHFAHAAALAVAENPGTAYNPLVLCGPPGVGKTHLLHSIGNYLVRHGDGIRVRATTAETFANEFIAAIHTKRPAAFKARYRDIDVLLVDDVQFLMAKARTEEEFFHTFNALRDAGAQIVLTSDRAPRDLDRLEERLRDRFQSGLVADVRPPDMATRLTALRKRAELDGLDVPDDRVLEVIAARSTSNLRSLEGALIRVVAFSSLTGRPLDADLAHDVLDDLDPADRARPGSRRPAGPSIQEIQELTSAAFGISTDELLSPSRSARLAWPRQVAMFLARQHTAASLPTIGAQFGGRGHTTVMHACRRAAERLADDPEAAQLVNGLSTRLSTHPAPGDADRHD